VDETSGALRQIRPATDYTLLENALVQGRGGAMTFKRTLAVSIFEAPAKGLGTPEKMSRF
jgi:hypothetical protein